MPPLSSIIMALQGMFGLLNGTASLISRSAAAKNLEVMQIASTPAVHAIALGSVSIGYVAHLLIYLFSIFKLYFCLTTSKCILHQRRLPL